MVAKDWYALNKNEAPVAFGDFVVFSVAYQALPLPSSLIHPFVPVNTDNIRKPLIFCLGLWWSGLILSLRPANERRFYFVPTSLIGWAQT